MNNIIETDISKNNWDKLNEAISEHVQKDVLQNHINQETKASLNKIFLYSPYLSSVIHKFPELLIDIKSNAYDKTIDNLLLQCINKNHLQTDVSALMKDLRILKQKVSFIIAYADINNDWNLDSVTSYLTKLAETCLKLAVDYIMLSSAMLNKIKLKHGKNPSLDCGYTVIAMGKLGSKELNYSSDIDLIVLYDESKINYIGRNDTRDFCIRATQELIKIIESRTEDGYVFRTDLRLRPDPASTPIAVSIETAENYYETMGMNWERAAMIKARSVAGDISLGSDFIKYIRPFIWRRNLDLRAIKDIYAIKNQIKNQHSNNLDNSLMGHNIKLGTGGIRFIEFYAQIQQLIWGGKKPILREQQTLKALELLYNDGLISKADLDKLTSAYIYLRNLEHRLQMVEDEQTQTLPKSSDEYAKIAYFSNYNNSDDFSKELISHLKNVDNIFNKLFPDINGDANHISFTSETASPDNLELLRSLSFTNAEAVYEIIRKWQSGYPKILRTQKARDIFDELIPYILEKLSKSDNPDSALIQFDTFISKLPASEQIINLLGSSKSIIDLIIEVISTAPKLGSYLSSHPSVMDNVLSPSFFSAIPDYKTLSSELKIALENSLNLEDCLHACRNWFKGKEFQLGIQMLKGFISGIDAGKKLAEITDITIGLLLPYVRDDLRKRYGYFDNVSLALVAFGKLGSREMSFDSDLDLMFIYDMPNLDVQSNGGTSSIAPSTYFTKLVQRFSSAVTLETYEGKLWEIDMRLRPSGNAGPLATSLEGFRNYQLNEAWVWEHQALTKARVIYGNEAIKTKIETIIKSVLSRRRNNEELAQEILKMRERIAGQFTPSSILDIKYTDGGMIDIEFFVQYMILANAHQYPDKLIGNSTKDTIIELSNTGIITKEQAEVLSQTYSLLISLKALFSQTIEGKVTIDNIPEACQQKITQITKQNSFADAIVFIEKSLSTAKNICSKYY